MKGVLFDLDGIIANTATLHWKAWQALIQSHYQRVIPVAVAEQTKGVDRMTSLKIILDALGVEEPSEQMARLAADKNKYYQAALTELMPAAVLPGINDLLVALRQAGIRIALASASQNGGNILRQLGLYDQFDAVIDPKTVQNGKPAPDIFVAAANAIGLSPADCVGVEDAAAGVAAINASGAVAVAVGDTELLGDAEKVVSSTAELTVPVLQAAWLTARGD